MLRKTTDPELSANRGMAMESITIGLNTIKEEPRFTPESSIPDSHPSDLNVAENNGSRIISKPWNGNGEYNYWIEYYQGRASFCAGVIYSRFSCVVAPNQPIVGVWNHIVATANSSTMKIFLNGVEEKSKNYSITDWKPGYDINRALAIGTLYPYWTEWPGLTGFSFKGEIDEVAIFTR